MKRNGFTLIEAVVVAAVLAIVSAAIVPAIREARVNAQRVHCASNMRHVGIALREYFVEYSNDKPLWGTGSPSYRSWEMLWPVALAPYLAVPNIDTTPLAPFPNSAETGKHYEFMRQIYTGGAARTSSLFCPLDDTTYPSWGSVSYPAGVAFTNRSTYGAVQPVWNRGGSAGTGYAYNDYANVPRKDEIFTLPENSTSYAVPGNATVNKLMFGRAMSAYSPNSPVFGHGTGKQGSYGCYTAVEAVNTYGARNYGFFVAGSATATFDSRLSHGNRLPTVLLDGHVEYVTPNQVRDDYLAAGGNPTAQMSYSSTFAASYGPQGEQALYGGSTAGRLNFTPW